MSEQTNSYQQAPQWMGGLTERENKEIAFCKLYARDFAHGTTGHNAMMLVAKLAKMLDDIENRPTARPAE